MSFLVVRPEIPADGPAIEGLLDRSFGADRFKKISYRYRYGVAPVEDLCLVAEDAHGEMTGTIRHWPLTIDRQPALLLGPVAIQPGHRGQGIGRALVTTSLARAAELGWDQVILVGDPAYYEPLGFVTAPATLVMPGEDPHRLMIAPLAAGLPVSHGTLLPWTAADRRPHPRHAAGTPDLLPAPQRPLPVFHIDRTPRHDLPRVA